MKEEPYDRPSPCPKCGTLCVLVVHINQERENTCPKCGVKFTDFSEQFEGNFVGAYTEASEPGDLPIALFLHQKDFDRWLELMKKADDPDEDYRHDGLFPQRVSAYGSAWMGMDDDPWATEFQAFLPASLEHRFPLLGSEGLDATVPEPAPLAVDPQQGLSLHVEAQLAVNAFVYDCRQTNRLYLFYRLWDELQYASINKGPTDFPLVYLRGIKVALEKAAPSEQLEFLTWDEFRSGGGKIELSEEAYDGRRHLKERRGDGE